MNKFSLFFVVAFLSSCASTQRGPSSTYSSAQTLELAQKLNSGKGELTFNARREDGELSALGFLKLRIDNCVAVVNAEYENGRGSLAEDNYVECDVSIESEIARTSMKAKIAGEKKDFSIKFVTEKANVYSLTAEARVYHENKKWKGSGEVIGWLNQKIGKNGRITATVREIIEL